MADGFISGLLRGIGILLLGYLLFTYPKQVIRFIKYLLGKNNEYAIAHFVLFVIPTSLISFVLSLVLFLYLNESYHYELGDMSIYGITAFIPLVSILLFIRKRKQLKPKTDSKPDTNTIYEYSDCKHRIKPETESVKNTTTNSVTDSLPTNDSIKYCKYCGKQISSTATFCKYCGNKL